MRIARSLLIALVTLACALPAAADEQQAFLDEVVKRVQEVYSRHCCFKAAFDQLTVNVAMDLQDRFQGVMYVRRPGWISLEVESPERQKVVIKGRSYVVMFMEDGNVVRGEVPPEINLEHFFGFFANIGDIERNFTVRFPTKVMDKDDKLIFIELGDKKDPRTTFRILLGIDSEFFTIRRAIIYDALGNYNRFDLFSMTFLETIPDRTFEIAEGQAALPAPNATPSSKDAKEK